MLHPPSFSAGWISHSGLVGNQVFIPFSNDGKFKKKVWRSRKQNSKQTKLNDNQLEELLEQRPSFSSLNGIFSPRKGTELFGGLFHLPEKSKLATAKRATFEGNKYQELFDYVAEWSHKPIDKQTKPILVQGNAGVPPPAADQMVDNIKEHAVPFGMAAFATVCGVLSYPIISAVTSKALSSISSLKL